MVMYSHQFGPRSGGLTVLLANDKVSPVWKRGGALGDVWVRTEVELVSSSVFQVSAAPPVHHRSPPSCQRDSSPSYVIGLAHPSTWWNILMDLKRRLLNPGVAGDWGITGLYNMSILLFALMQH